jgi:hypothetical protein
LIATGRGNERGTVVKSRKGVRGLLGVVVGLLALVGVGAAAAHYLYEPYNHGFLKYPTIVALHVILGGLYLAPFQFVRRIRSRHLGYHRWAGRVLVSILGPQLCASW